MNFVSPQIQSTATRLIILFTDLKKKKSTLNPCMCTCYPAEVERVKLNGFMRSIKRMELAQEHAESLKKTKCLKIGQNVLLKVVHTFFGNILFVSNIVIPLPVSFIYLFFFALVFLLKSVIMRAVHLSLYCHQWCFLVKTASIRLLLYTEAKI